jgi:F-type H+-transporting ATPase subunit a
MVTLAPDVLTHIGPFPITNTLIDTFLVDTLIIGGTYYISKRITFVPSLLQGLMEVLMEAFYNLTQTTAEDRTKKIFPYVMTFFLFILISNWSGLLPIITSFGFFHDKEFIPLIRSASTDLNTTLALALVSIVATHSMSIQTIGIKQYLGRFFSWKPLALYTGLLELISEFTKVISFSFRLFGNIFVGELMLASLSTFFALLLPIPLVLYETAVGAIQALIFALLTMAFMAILTTPHHAD